jgi:aldose 1-epimerase
VALYTLKNANGMEVDITNFGGRIVSIMVPDKEGKMQDVVLGFSTGAEYFPTNNASDFGAAIGRYANRINQGIIKCDNQQIQLPQNNFGHCLHGGPSGWQYQVYEANLANDSVLELTMDSPDGDNNFPGNVKAKVTYTLTSDNAIEIAYEATTDKQTVINMTNHSYFNLSGDANNTILDETLFIDADAYTPVDSTFMTTGEIIPVENTPMDFRTPKAIGQDIDSVSFDQLLFARGEASKVAADKGGYDHNWVLNTKGDQSKVAVKLSDPRSGITLEVYTNEPGIQVYTGNFLDGSVTGKNGIKYNRQAAICLETQKYPDSPNKNWKESNAYLNPGETYFSYCKFKFGVEK